MDVVALPFLMLLVTPFFIFKLRIEQYGIWMLVNSIVAGFGVFNAGLADVTIKYVSKYRAKKDIQNIVRIIRTTCSLSFILTIVIFASGVVVSYAIDNFDLFKISQQFKGILLVSIRIASLLFGLKLIELNVLAVFKGFERYDISSKISIVSKSFLLITQLIVVALGHSLKEVFEFSVAIAFVAIIAEMYLVKRFYKEISFFLCFQRQSIKEVFSFGVWSWFQSILRVMGEQTDKYIVAFFAGATYLAYYSIASMIATQIHAFFSAGASWIFPYVSRKTESNINVGPIYYKMQFVILLLGLLSISVLFYSKDFIFRVWLGNETYANSKQLIEMFFYFNIFMLPTIVPYYFFIGSGYIKLSTILILISTIMTIIFMISGFSLIGNIGLIWGKIASVIIVSPALLKILHKKVLGEKDMFSGFKLFVSSLLLVLALNFKSLYTIILFLLCLISFKIFYYDKIRLKPYKI